MKPRDWITLSVFVSGAGLGCGRAPTVKGSSSLQPSGQCYFLAWPKGKPPDVPPDTISFDSVAVISPWTTVVVDTLGLSLGAPLNDVRYTLSKDGKVYWWKPSGDSLFIFSSTGESGAVMKGRRDERAFAGVGFASYDVIVNGRAETSDTFSFYAKPIACR